MNNITYTALLALMSLCACTGPQTAREEVPGHLLDERIERDTQTCEKLKALSTHDHGFAFEIARDCRSALRQIQSSNTELDTFDVARAYLDAMYDYEQTIRIVMENNNTQKTHSDFGAYLIGRTTGLTGPMKDWRDANGLIPHPELYTPNGQKMV